MVDYQMEIQGDLGPWMTCEQIQPYVCGTSAVLNFNANIPPCLCVFVNDIINGNKTFKFLASRIVASIIRYKSFTITSVR